MNFQNQIDYLREVSNEDMLDGVSVPNPLNTEDLKTQIVFRCGLLIPCYPEPEIMRTAIRQFFRRESWNIEHLVNIILAEYSPIENTDRYEEHETTNTGGGSETHSGTDKRKTTNSGTDQRDIQEGGTTKDETTNLVSAFNATTFQNDTKSEDTITHGKKTDDDFTYGKITDNDVTYGKKVTSEENGSSKYTEHTHGNIGVTTNQQMIEAELELLRHFDVYDWIASKLESELFLQIY